MVTFDPIFVEIIFARTLVSHTQKLGKLFGKDIGEAHAPERSNIVSFLEYFGEAKVEGDAMTSIPAKVLAIDKQAERHRIVVRIELGKYRGSFNTLEFGEKKPLMGSCRDGRLDLIYNRDPGLKEGESFLLWRIQ